MKRFLPRPIKRALLTRREERGNFLVTTALILVVLIGVIALVIDVGFAAGQRRFMQNGADAAALAAANLLSYSVQPYPNPFTPPWPNGIPNYFGVKDGAVWTKAHDIATENRNPGLTGRTTDFEVKVEYCVAVNQNSYLPQTPGCPSPNNWVVSKGESTPNASVPDGAYKVRVTVRSTITTMFGRVIDKDSTSTVGQATAIILGVCEQMTGSGPVMPFTLWDGQDLGLDPYQYFTGKFFPLWSPDADRPKAVDQNWKNVLDFSPPTAWCDGLPSEYDWGKDDIFANMIPVGTNCTPDQADPTKDFAGSDATWNRVQPDYQYAADDRPACIGTSTNPDDVYNWISAGFDGTVGTGMKVPVYPHLGDNGRNIARAIWGTDPNPCNNKYFFQGVTAVDPVHPDWGVYRDVTVFTYDVPLGQGGHFYKITGHSSTGWVDVDPSRPSSDALGRVTLVHALNVRIYQKPPHRNSSEVIGLVVGPSFPDNYQPQNCPVFGYLGPGIFGNVVRLGA